jgi:signal transduction histidine kinase
VDTAVADVRRKNGMIQIRVEDAGKGFDYQAVRAKEDRGSGFGLYTLEDRMSFLGGSMQIETRPGEGCRVVLTVPQDASPKTASPGPPPEDTVKPALMQAAPAAPV